MNPIVQIFTNLSDEEIRESILEIKEDEGLGIVRSDGYVRRIAKEVSDLTGTSLSTQLFLTTTSLLKEGAFRFVK